MKTFLTVFVLSTAVATAPALAFSLNMGDLTRELNFPYPTPDKVTKDKAPSGN